MTFFYVAIWIYFRNGVIINGLEFSLVVPLIEGVFSTAKNQKQKI